MENKSKNVAEADPHYEKVQVEETVAISRSSLKKLMNDLDVMEVQCKRVQERCWELLQENRTLREKTK